MFMRDMSMAVGNFHEEGEGLGIAQLVECQTCEQRHIKDPGHSAKNVGCRLHAYTFDPAQSDWADYALCGNL